MIKAVLFQRTLQRVTSTVLASPNPLATSARSLPVTWMGEQQHRCLSSGNKNRSSNKDKGKKGDSNPSSKKKNGGINPSVPPKEGIQPVSKAESFSVRRRENPQYRPIQLPKMTPRLAAKKSLPKEEFVPKDDLEATYGRLRADEMRELQKEMERNNLLLKHFRDEDQYDVVEEDLRIADYWNSPLGSTEDLVGERQAMATMTLQEREKFQQDTKVFMRELEPQVFNFEDELYEDARKKLIEKERREHQEARYLEGSDDMDAAYDADEDPDTRMDPHQRVFGEWGEMLIRVDRTNKNWRGGRLESYRALVIGGNANGCAGFGVGKAKDPMQAVDAASRQCKKHVYYVERYQQDGLTRDLVGKQNSCKVILLANDQRGLAGNPLCREILKRFGIVNVTAKAFGNRHHFNVVRATFKAILTHESIHQIALKRGKRLVSVERARRMGV